MRPYFGPPSSTSLIMREIWWWTQSASNSSLPNSLLNRVFAGKFAKFERSKGGTQARTGGLLPGTRKSSGGITGNFLTASGNQNSISGKLKSANRYRPPAPDKRPFAAHLVCRHRGAIFAPFADERNGDIEWREYGWKIGIGTKRFGAAISRLGSLSPRTTKTKRRSVAPRLYIPADQRSAVFSTMPAWISISSNTPHKSQQP